MCRHCPCNDRPRHCPHRAPTAAPPQVPSRRDSCLCVCGAPWEAGTVPAAPRRCRPTRRLGSWSARSPRAPSPACRRRLRRPGDTYHRLSAGHLLACWHPRPSSSTAATQANRERGGAAATAVLHTLGCGWTRASLLNLCLRRQARRAGGSHQQQEAGSVPAGSGSGAGGTGGQGSSDGWRTGPPSLAARRRESAPEPRPTAVVFRGAAEGGGEH